MFTMQAVFLVDCFNETVETIGTLETLFTPKNGLKHPKNSDITSIFWLFFTVFRSKTAHFRSKNTQNRLKN